MGDVSEARWAHAYEIFGVSTSVPQNRSGGDRHEDLDTRGFSKLD